jgi:ribosomal RNA-processing protein 9
MGTQQLYSGSFDRTVKLFDLSVLGYVETLFGHQDPVLSLDALRGETAVSVGGMDKTVRYWKIAEETQLVFRGGARSAVRDLLDGGAVEGLEEDGEGRDHVTEDGGNLAKLEVRKGQAKNFVEGSLECVAMIDETTFVSGGDSG